VLQMQGHIDCAILLLSTSIKLHNLDTSKLWPMVMKKYVQVSKQIPVLAKEDKYDLHALT